MVGPAFWKGKKVFITGHTGFKGSWLSIWLDMLGAKVTGYALTPPTKPSLFAMSGIEKNIIHITGDIRDYEHLRFAMSDARPEIVFHLAAQPLVLESYKNPAYTYEVNAMGTVNLLECVRRLNSVKAVVNVTTDKCYQNNNWDWGYRENDRLGGHDPYSNSKACSELITSAYVSSFFADSGVNVATARAGNVIGGGDYAENRLVPDIIRAFEAGRPVEIRNPRSVRPWQHVLEPLSGYMMLAEKLYSEGAVFSGGWNFGPNDNDAKEVLWIVEKLCGLWGNGASYTLDGKEYPKEANLLKLDISKAKNKLGWHPQWPLERALERIIGWQRDVQAGQEVLRVCRKQIEEYMG